jgi:hypothetical protein
VPNQARSDDEKDRSSPKRILSQHPRESSPEVSSAVPSRKQYSFQLLFTGGLPSIANSNSLRLLDLFANPDEIEQVFISNYMFDMEWLWQQVPVLAIVPVTIVHGERRGRGDYITVRSRPECALASLLTE